MKIYIFGNQDIQEDNLAFKVAEKLKGKIENIEFVEVKPNADVPFTNEKNLVIMDVVQEIDKVKIISENDIEKIALSPRFSAHDFDLGFQLKYLKKLGKLGKITIIGLPQNGDVDYFLIQSILRKFVAHDIHGS